MRESPGLPRVVLVEDDPSVRRFVELALEEQPIELVSCQDVAQARGALRERPAALLITDLMLPGESGLSFIASLSTDHALRGALRIAVFSAGVNARVEGELASMPVWRVLSKPASLASIVACVRDALTDEPAAAVTETAAGGEGDGKARLGAARPPAAAPRAPPRPLNEQDAISRHFEGDGQLFDAYRATCRSQFPADIAEGDQALQRGDLQRLRRLAHSLKTVLLTLGQTPAGQVAARLERDAADGDADAAAAGWRALSSALAEGS